MTTVVLADDQRVVREGLATLLGLLPGIEVVGYPSLSDALVTALSTNAVVANLPELSPALAAGAVGVPVKLGELSGAAPVTCATA